MFEGLDALLEMKKKARRYGRETEGLCGTIGNLPIIGASGHTGRTDWTVHCREQPCPCNCALYPSHLPFLYFLPVLHKLLRNIVNYYLSGNRWWLPLAAGALYPLAMPPFNHELHWLLFPLPFFAFAVLLPLFAVSVQPSLKRATGHSFLYGFTASLGQFYWLIFDRVEGLWLLVIIGLVLISAVVALIYLAAGLLFRMVACRIPLAKIWVFPAIWVLIDYCRTLGDLAFPWSFLGYTLTPMLPLAQAASITGVWGLTYLVILGNMLLWQLLTAARRGSPVKGQVRSIAVFAAALLVAALGGWFRIAHYSKAVAPSLKISLLQPDIDPLYWNNAMLDTSFAVSESLAIKTAEDKPDIMILPESALLCYIAHEEPYRDRVNALVRHTGIPLIFGSLDWEHAPSAAPYRYNVYNTAFLAEPGATGLGVYHKMRLVPFSEAIPFEGLFPILSRVNIGTAGFQHGTKGTIFRVGTGIKAAPLICYEAIFPDFVRRRAHAGANLLVNVTNDGWFGKSSGPFQHAAMARMRSIETGVAMARSANSGISMVIDPLGRRFGATGLYVRTTLTRTIPWQVIPTIYTKFGDWFISFCLIVAAAGILAAFRKSPSPA